MLALPRDHRIKRGPKLEVQRRAVNCLLRQELDCEAEYIQDSRGCLQVRLEVVEIVWSKRLSRTGGTVCTLVARAGKTVLPLRPHLWLPHRPGTSRHARLDKRTDVSCSRMPKKTCRAWFLQHFDSHDSDKALCCDPIVISEHLLVIKNITLYTSLTPAIRLICIFRLCASLRTPITKTSHRNPASAPV